MKKLLASLLIPLSGSLFSQTRITNPTYESWEFPNLSVETFQESIITGFTEVDPTTGKTCPAFKITDLSGANINTFRLNFDHNVQLTDFTVKPGSGNIILTGVATDADPSFPFILLVAEITNTGAPVQSYLHFHPDAGKSRIPHQVIYSPVNDQVVIAGTQINGGTPDPDNYKTLSKSGFALILKAADLSNMLFSYVFNSPYETNDYDMLESVTETSTGYFICGSSNYQKKQALQIVGLSPCCGITFSDMHGISGKNVSGSSVLYNAALNRVYVLCNDQQMRQFRVAYFNPATGIALSDFFHYNLLGAPADMAFNGFKLQTGPNNYCVVAGYLSKMVSSPTYLSPFQVSLTHDLNTLALAKFFGSDNYSSLKGYFAEDGYNPFINTPDMFTLSMKNEKGYLVNQNTVSKSYDLDITTLFTIGFPCEENISYFIEQKPPNPVTKPVATESGTYPYLYSYNLKERDKDQIVLCASASTMATKPEISASPNPASDFVTIQSDLKISKIVVYNATGTDCGILVPEITRGGSRVSVAHLVTGVYLLVITDNEGNEQRLRLIKQ